MKATILTLPGDGIGPEVMAQARAVLETIASRYGHEFVLHEGLIGGIAIDTVGDSFPEETRKLGEQADAILLAAVGGYKWDNPQAKDRPERGLLAMRKHFAVCQPAPCEDLPGAGAARAAAA